LLNRYEVRRFGSGETVIREGEQRGLLFFLIEGVVEVYKDDVFISRTG
jgi:CRP-like cAMP-binding protein